MTKQYQTRILQQAWIGDSILAVYVRLKILGEEGAISGERAATLTSNQLLATIGEPTRVEARIGEAFEHGGFDAAFRWIDEHLLPVFERQSGVKKRPSRRTGSAAT